MATFMAVSSDLLAGFPRPRGSTTVIFGGLAKELWFSASARVHLLGWGPFSRWRLEDRTSDQKGLRRNADTRGRRGDQITEKEGLADFGLCPAYRRGPLDRPGSTRRCNTCLCGERERGVRAWSEPDSFDRNAPRRCEAVSNSKRKYRASLT